MKMPSLRLAFNDARRTLNRFPFVLLAAALGTAAAIILVDYKGPPGPSVLFQVLLAAILGLPLLLALALVAEKKRWGRPAALAAQAAGVVLLAAYSLSVPADLLNAPAEHVLRALLLAVALCMLVAVAPFSGRGELNGFWHYNKALFLRILTTMFYSLVLYAGLSLALAALDNLFGMDVAGKRYAELLILITGLFSTWFFLAGVPDDLNGLEASADYPKGIRIFAQHILLPLVLVYFFILYAYLAKIIITWDWPRGWVGGLILGFAAVGISSLLLLEPVRKQTENAWIRTFSRWFPVALAPLVVMLFLALWRRISEYGVTEDRYLGVALGVWLAVVVACLAVPRWRNIKVIPATFGLAALVVSFGPWGAFAVSERSQVARLGKLLAGNGILVNGAVRKAPGAVSGRDRQQISSILAYLHEIHGYAGIQPWFHESLLKDPAGRGLASKDPAAVAGIMGIEFAMPWGGEQTGMISLVYGNNRTCDVSGYDRMLRAQHLSPSGRSEAFPGQELSWQIDEGMDILTLSRIRDGRAVDTLQLDLRPTIHQLLKEYNNAGTRGIPPDRMTATASSGTMRVKVLLWNIFLRRTAGRWQPQVYDADIFYTTAPQP